MLDEDFLNMAREVFTLEADGLLRAMTEALRELEQAPAPARRKEVVETIFRDAHSLKGAAATVDRSDISSVCQGLENIFAQWKTSDVLAPKETFELLNRAVNLLVHLLQQSGTNNDSGDQGKIGQILHELEWGCSHQNPCQ